MSFYNTKSPIDYKISKISINIVVIPRFSHAKKGVVTEQNAQGAELGSFAFLILRVILELYIAKLEFTGGLQIISRYCA